jgi:hypothetical protein
MDMSSESMLLACLSVIAREHNENKDWKGWCDEVRDGSVALSKQFATKSAPASKKAHTDMQKGCTDCHDVYRKE